MYFYWIYSTFCSNIGNMAFQLKILCRIHSLQNRIKISNCVQSVYIKKFHFITVPTVAISLGKQQNNKIHSQSGTFTDGSTEIVISDMSTYNDLIKNSLIKCTVDVLWGTLPWIIGFIFFFTQVRTVISLFYIAAQ